MATDNLRQVDSNGIFATFSLWLRVLEFSAPDDICAFSQASSAFYSLVHIKNFDNESMWRCLLRRDYGVTSECVKRFAKEDATFKNIYIAYFRSRVSPAGCLGPNIMPKHVRRSIRRQEWAKLHGLRPFYVAQLYHTSTHGQRTIVAKYSPDETSYFKQVLELRRCWNVQVEGAVRAWKEGYYRVVWRLKLDKEYEDVGPLNFLAKVSPSSHTKDLMTEREADLVDAQERTWSEDEIANPLRVMGTHAHYVWNPPNPPLLPPNAPDLAVPPNNNPFGAIDQVAMVPDGGGLGVIAQLAFPLPGPPHPVPAPLDHNPFADVLNPPLHQIPEPIHPHGPENPPFPVNEWFDLLSGFLHVPHAHDAVCFALTNFTIGYKYGLYIDYVALVPVTQAEFDNQLAFPLGPLLMDSHQYWDSLCSSNLSQSFEHLGSLPLT